jgi:hypothetical protein
MIRKLVLFVAFLFSLPCYTYAQQINKTNEIYVDAKGIIRHSKDKSEASYFGVNYTLPFAYGYRSHKTLGIDIEQAIDRDVYHLARLGVNAFRVHVWDTEISDSLGNLKNNEHLRLFDYLLSKLEQRGIRIIITPIAFWGNGYPDKDERTGSFSDVYGKDSCVVSEKAFKAQERYLQQFFKHVNPYTQKTYTTDAFVIATEINNEPHHSGPKERATEYVNRMMAAIKSTGWNKPVFYNISESPWYADAVARSNVDGFSFQWYPTGLVAGHTHKGNLLPQVDNYVIPFDTIPQFKNKARMVYEFDAGDVMQPYMYPAMARGFKKAGFQWATQFAYDPLGTAFANTEYQTHYLNLAYTPAKAISLLIAGEVFRRVPAFKSYGTYPADTVFGPFRVSYKQQLSEMNTTGTFYYSNNTLTKPINAGTLKHVAGVGSSLVVQYAGTGAYFLDKLPNGSWRLEVMPDAVPVKDPFEKTSLATEVTRIVYTSHNMKVNMPALGKTFKINAVNKGNLYNTIAAGGNFTIKPGTYLLQKAGAKPVAPNTKIGQIALAEFEAPYTKSTDLALKGSDLNTKEPVSTSDIIYQPATDRNKITIYSPDWKGDSYEYINGSNGQLLLKLKHKPSASNTLGGLELYIKDKITAEPYKSISVNAEADKPMPAKLILINADANAYSADLIIQNGRIDIPLNTLKPDAFVLLPRPYPGFQSLIFSSGTKQIFRLNAIEKIQLLLKGDAKQEVSVTIGNIGLNK